MQANVNSSAAKSGVSAGCITVFMLPFFAFGAFAMFLGGRELLRGGVRTQAVLPMLFGAVFAGIAVVVVTVARAGLRTAAENQALREQNPAKPWLWRKDWSDGAIVSEGAAQSYGLAFFALLWNAIAMPAAYIVIARGDFRTNPVVLTVMIFPAVGVVLLVTAIYYIVRAKKYGESRVMLSHIPIPIGTTCRGEIVTHVKERPENGFTLKLQCVRRVTTSTGKSSSTTETELFRDEQNVSTAAVIPTFEGMRVPFAFDIPSDTEPADESNRSNRVVWRLTVGAETPGVDYAAQFELPVFRTAESQEMKRFVPSASEVISWSPSAESGITVRDDEIHIGTHARFRDVFAMLFFCAFWFGAIALMRYFHVPIIIPIFFALIGLVIVYALIDSIIGRTTIRADSTGVTVRRRWFGKGSASTYTPAQIKSIVANPTQSSNTYQVDIINDAGRKITIASWISLRRDAEMIAARLARIVGR